MGESRTKVAARIPSTEDDNDEKMGQGRNKQPCWICGRVYGNGDIQGIQKENEARWGHFEVVYWGQEERPRSGLLGRLKAVYWGQEERPRSGLLGRPKAVYWGQEERPRSGLLGRPKGSLIWLLLLLPLVSTQCSNCLGGRCYDTGQCIQGCVPGYVDSYCNDACPSNCLNNACLVNTTSATITCTDGCRPGYCGTKCTRPCPEGCVTCDRQCGSCNKTLCPERRYGEGCRSVCSPFYEKCDRETGQCIKCRRGYYGDICDRKCPTCFREGENLMYKCLSGCEVCKEQEVKDEPISRMLLLILIICVAMSVLIMTLVYLLYVPRLIRRGKKSLQNGNDDQKERKRLTGEMI